MAASQHASLDWVGYRVGGQTAVAAGAGFAGLMDFVGYPVGGDTAVAKARSVNYYFRRSGKR